MNIQVSENAKEALHKTFPERTIRLSIIDGCCGKSFALDVSTTSDENDVHVGVKPLTFVMHKEDVKLANKIAIDVPGPIDGFMITNVNAVGGCACGRSFFVE